MQQNLGLIECTCTKVCQNAYVTTCMLFGIVFTMCIAEVMGALVSVLMIWVVTGVLVYMAVQRVVTGEYEIDATVMLITAGIGVGFNIM